MAVETAGFVKLSGDPGPGIAVKVIVEAGRMRIVSDDEQLADWAVSDLGVRALQDGFLIKAAGDEYYLRSEDDALLAEELGLVAASPRLARMIAARHRPDEPPEVAEPEEAGEAEESNVGPLAYALGGALVLTGGVLFRLYAATATGQPADVVYQWPFIFGGMAMVAAGLALALRVAYSRVGTVALLVVMVIVLGFAIGDIRIDGSRLIALGLIAGGVVVAVSALAWGGRSPGGD